MTKLTDFLQELRDRLPLSAVVSRHVSIKKKGREFSGLCPFHQEKGASFTVNDEKGFYHCFGCGAHGDHYGFVMEKVNIPFMEAVAYLAEQAGIIVPKFDRPDGEPSRAFSDAKITQEEFAPLYDINEAASLWFQQQLRIPSAAFVCDYLKKRGMSGDIAKKFQVGYAPDRGLKEHLLAKGFTLLDIAKCGLVIEPEGGARAPYDRFRSRVMFPIQDQRGRVIAFGGRIIHEGEPKYLNSPDTPLFNKGKLLYGISHSLPTVRAKKPEGMPFVVVEGYMDVISLHQAGITSAVAPLGTALTTDQIQLMWRTCPQPLLCFDGDAAGRRAAYRAVDRVLGILKPGGYTLGFCFLPEGEDPDSLVQKGAGVAMRELLATPIGLADVLWQIFMEQRLLTTPEQKAKARGDLLDLTKGIHDPELQHFYREDLNGRLQQKLKSQQQSRDWGVKNWVPRNIPNQQNLIQSQGSRLLQNKFVLGEKILLAILINHPTLIAEVVEQLMTLPLQASPHSREENHELFALRQVLLDFCAQCPNGDHIQLKTQLINKGFEQLVRGLLSRDLYDKARFAHPSTPLEQVLAGWQEVWRTIQTSQHLKDEVKMTSSALKSTLDEQAWEKLKLLKMATQ